MSDNTETLALTPARISGRAYSGGAMRLPGWKHPVVVDLAGLTLPEILPLLADHENRVAARLGEVRAWIEGGGLFIDGAITAAGSEARDIVAQARAGTEWQ